MAEREMIKKKYDYFAQRGSRDPVILMPEPVCINNNNFI